MHRSLTNAFLSFILSLLTRLHDILTVLKGMTRKNDDKRATGDPTPHRPAHLNGDAAVGPWTLENGFHDNPNGRL